VEHEVDKPLELRVTRLGEAMLVCVRGGVDNQEAERFRNVIEHLAGEPSARLILDLTEMDFICSTALGAIVFGHKKSRAQQGALKLVNPQGPILELLEVTRLTELFSIFASVDAAMA
jgi:anti-sigma B factor antagonist